MNAKLVLGIVVLILAPYTVWACVQSLEEKKAEFTKADIDQNGALNTEELITFMGPEQRKRLHEIFNKTDKNKDGGISPEEFLQYDRWEGEKMRPKCTPSANHL